MSFNLAPILCTYTQENTAGVFEEVGRKPVSSPAAVTHRESGHVNLTTNVTIKYW